MTSEQIAELRRMANREGFAAPTDKSYDLGAAVTKLLDEREALLTAAKDLRDLVYNAFRVIGDSPEKIAAHVSIVAADAAIAKAESP